MSSPFGDECSSAEMHLAHLDTPLTPDSTFEVQDIAVVTLEQLNDLLITAVEGGTGYWAYVQNYEWDGVEVASAEFQDMEDESSPWHKVTALDFLPILPLIRSNSGQASGWNIPEILENQDADIADIAVQLAIFGKVVYG